MHFSEICDSPPCLQAACSCTGVKSALQVRWTCGMETWRRGQVMLVTRAPWCLFASVLLDDEKQIRFKKRGGGGGRQNAQRSCKSDLTLGKKGVLQRKHYLSIEFGGGGFRQKLCLHMEKVCDGRDCPSAVRESMMTFWSQKLMQENNSDWKYDKKVLEKINNLRKNLAGDATGLLHGNLQSQAFWKGWGPIKAKSSQCEVTCASQGTRLEGYNTVKVVATSKKLWFPMDVPSNAPGWQL